MSTRDLEPFIVRDVRTTGSPVTPTSPVILMSSSGVVFFRLAGDFTRIPVAGEELVLETRGSRITGLHDPAADSWLFRWSDADLAAQDSAAEDGLLETVTANPPPEPPPGFPQPVIRLS